MLVQYMEKQEEGDRYKLETHGFENADDPEPPILRGDLNLHSIRMMKCRIVMMRSTSESPPGVSFLGVKEVSSKIQS